MICMLEVLLYLYASFSPALRSGVSIYSGVFILLYRSIKYCSILLCVWIHSETKTMIKCRSNTCYNYKPPFFDLYIFNYPIMINRFDFDSFKIKNLVDVNLFGDFA